MLIAADQSMICHFINKSRHWRLFPFYDDVQRLASKHPFYHFSLECRFFLKKLINSYILLETLLWLKKIGGLIDVHSS